MTEIRDLQARIDLLEKAISELFGEVDQLARYTQAADELLAEGLRAAKNERQIVDAPLNWVIPPGLNSAGHRQLARLQAKIG